MSDEVKQEQMRPALPEYGWRSFERGRVWHYARTIAGKTLCGRPAKYAPISEYEKYIAESTKCKICKDKYSKAKQAREVLT